MEIDVTTFGEELLIYRQLKGRTQEEFADELGVNRSTLSAWETNRSAPSAKHVRLLLEKRVITLPRARELLIRNHEGYPVGSNVCEIRLNPGRELINNGVRFGVLYIRKGNLDDDLWRQKPLNLEFKCKLEGSRGQPSLVATVRQPDRQGFQFKCFAEFDNLGWRHVAKCLRAAGYIPDKSPSDGTLRRIYFLIPDEQIINGPPPKLLKDNYFWPA